ncbi:hypothetical protein HDU85_003333 [Gaertneriomyces sp. JEL0708]|nr:hypothetical protein HDU85_003333 [Gaertneriomyces sp. JEL0708]
MDAFDVEEAIQKELQALEDAERFDHTMEFQEQTGSNELVEEPVPLENTLEQLPSWKEYLQTIASRQSLLDVSDAMEHDAAVEESGVAQSVANTNSPPYDILATTEDSELALLQDWTDPGLESELASSMRDLQEKCSSENAMLEALQQAAEAAGVLETTPSPREAMILATVASENLAHGSQARHDACVKGVRLSGNVGGEQTTGPVLSKSESVPATAVEDEERQLLLAEEKSLQAEYEYLTGRQREEAGEQSKLQFRLDSFAATRNAQVRVLREYKKELRELQDRARKLSSWLGTDGRNIYEKERERSSSLVLRVNNLSPHFDSLGTRAENHLGFLKKSAEDHESELSILRDQLKPIQEQVESLSPGVENMRQQIAAQEAELNDKRSRRSTLLLKQLALEETVRQKELDLLLDNLRKEQRREEVKMAELMQLESLELQEASLIKIPDLEKAPNVRHIVLDKNLLSDLKGLEALKDLRSLSLQNNNFVSLDLALFSELRVVNAAGNHLSDVQGLEQIRNLQELDLSDNPLHHLRFLQGARALNVCCLRNTQIEELRYLENLRSLIYLDLSYNRLHAHSLDELSNCDLLTYLNLSHNNFQQFPRTPGFLLSELDVSYNSIRMLSVARWSPQLRYLDASFNRLRQIDSMTMCPFLTDLNLADNYLSDIGCLFAIVPCVALHHLNLTNNPVTKDHNFELCTGVLFPRLKTLNGRNVAHKPFELGSPVKTIKWCKAAYRHLAPHRGDESKESNLVALGEFRRLSKAQERTIESYMGRRYKPFFHYLVSGFGNTDESVKTAFTVREQRVSWLSAQLHQCGMEMNMLMDRFKPSFDTAVDCSLEELTERIDHASIITVQALWRARQARRTRVLRLAACRTIQRYWKAYVDRKVAAALVREMIEQAATRIQTIWRGYHVRQTMKRFKPVRSKTSKSKKATVSHVHWRSETVIPVTAHDTSESSDSELEDAVLLDEWLQDLPEVEFDEKLNEYLSDEQLHHFKASVPTGSYLPPVVVPRVGSAKSTDMARPNVELDEREERLRHQLSQLLDHRRPPSKVIKARSTFHDLLVSHGVVPAHHPPRPTVGDTLHQPEGPGAGGWTAEMLLARRELRDAGQGAGTIEQRNPKDLDHQMPHNRETESAKEGMALWKQQADQFHEMFLKRARSKLRQHRESQSHHHEMGEYLRSGREENALGPAPIATMYYSWDLHAHLIPRSQSRHHYRNEMPTVEPHRTVSQSHDISSPLMGQRRLLLNGYLTQKLHPLVIASTNGAAEFR